VTVDDLIGAYIEASNAVVWEAEKRGLCPMSQDMHRAGVTAIVRALRDEIVPPTKSRAASSTMLTRHVLAGFDEILGDAGEKVAEMPDLPTRTVQLTGVTKSRRPDIQFEPATDAAPAFYAGQDPKISLNTDAAPAVCEWRGSKDGQLAYMGCTKRLEWTYDRRKCPSCGKPIAFKGS